MICPGLCNEMPTQSCACFTTFVSIKYVSFYVSSKQVSSHVGVLLRQYNDMLVVVILDGKRKKVEYFFHYLIEKVGEFL